MVAIVVVAVVALVVVVIVVVVGVVVVVVIVVVAVVKLGILKSLSLVLDFVQCVHSLGKYFCNFEGPYPNSSMG